jgi:hypothetical protein
MYFKRSWIVLSGGIVIISHISFIAVITCAWGEGGDVFWQDEVDQVTILEQPLSLKASVFWQLASARTTLLETSTLFVPTTPGRGGWCGRMNRPR